MARREFTQLPHKYGDGKYGFAQGQTRDGVEEFIMPVELRKKNPDTGLLEPSDELAQLKAELESVKEELQAIRASQTDGTQKVQVSGSLPVIWGATLDDRPAASSVDVGQIFALANGALDMWISNGISWEEIE